MKMDPKNIMEEYELDQISSTLQIMAASSSLLSPQTTTKSEQLSPSSQSSEKLSSLSIDDSCAKGVSSSAPSLVVNPNHYHSFQKCNRIVTTTSALFFNNTNNCVVCQTRLFSLFRKSYSPSSQNIDKVGNKEEPLQDPQTCVSTTNQRRSRASSVLPSGKQNLRNSSSSNFDGDNDVLTCLACGLRVHRKCAFAVTTRTSSFPGLDTTHDTYDQDAANRSEIGVNTYGGLSGSDADTEMVGRMPICRVNWERAQKAMRSSTASVDGQGESLAEISNNNNAVTTMIDLLTRKGHHNNKEDSESTNNKWSLSLLSLPSYRKPKQHQQHLSTELPKERQQEQDQQEVEVEEGSENEEIRITTTTTKLTPQQPSVLAASAASSSCINENSKDNNIIQRKTEEEQEATASDPPDHPSMLAPFTPPTLKMTQLITTVLWGRSLQTTTAAGIDADVDNDDITSVVLGPEQQSKLSSLMDSAAVSWNRRAHNDIDNGKEPQQDENSNNKEGLPPLPETDTTTAVGSAAAAMAETAAAVTDTTTAAADAAAAAMTGTAAAVTGTTTAAADAAAAAMTTLIQHNHDFLLLAQQTAAVVASVAGPVSSCTSQAAVHNVLPHLSHNTPLLDGNDDDKSNIVVRETGRCANEPKEEECEVVEVEDEEIGFRYTNSNTGEEISGSHRCSLIIDNSFESAYSNHDDVGGSGGNDMTSDSDCEDDDELDIEVLLQPIRSSSSPFHDSVSNNEEQNHTTPNRNMITMNKSCEELTRKAPAQLTIATMISMSPKSKKRAALHVNMPPPSIFHPKHDLPIMSSSKNDDTCLLTKEDLLFPSLSSSSVFHNSVADHTATGEKHQLMTETSTTCVRPSLSPKYNEKIVQTNLPCGEMMACSNEKLLLPETLSPQDLISTSLSNFSASSSFDNNNAEAETTILVWSPSGPPSHWAMQDPNAIRGLVSSSAPESSETLLQDAQENNTTIVGVASDNKNNNKNMHQLSQILQNNLLTLFAKNKNSSTTQRNFQKEQDEDLEHGSNVGNVKIDEEEIVFESTKSNDTLDTGDMISEAAINKKNNETDNQNVTPSITGKETIQTVLRTTSSKTRNNLARASFAGTIVGGAAGLILSGPAGMVLGSRAGQVVGAASVVVECGAAQLGVKLVLMGVGGAVAGYQSVKTMNKGVIDEDRVGNGGKLRFLAIGKNNKQHQQDNECYQEEQKIVLVRQGIELDPMWEDILNRSRIEKEKENKSVDENSNFMSIHRLMFLSHQKQETSCRPEDEELLYNTTEDEMSNDDKLFLLLSKWLNDRTCLIGHVYHIFIRTYRERHDDQHENHKDMEHLPQQPQEQEQEQQQEMENDPHPPAMFNEEMSRTEGISTVTITTTTMVNDSRKNCVVTQNKADVLNDNKEKNESNYTMAFDNHDTSTTQILPQKNMPVKQQLQQNEIQTGAHINTNNDNETNKSRSSSSKQSLDDRIYVAARETAATTSRQQRLDAHAIIYHMTTLLHQHISNRQEQPKPLLLPPQPSSQDDVGAKRQQQPATAIHPKWSNMIAWTVESFVLAQLYDSIHEEMVTRDILIRQHHDHMMHVIEGCAVLQRFVFRNKEKTTNYTSIGGTIPHKNNDDNDNREVTKTTSKSPLLPSNHHPPFYPEEWCVSREALDVIQSLPNLHSPSEKLSQCIRFMEVLSEAFTTHYTSSGSSSSNKGIKDSENNDHNKIMDADSLLEMVCIHLILAVAETMVDIKSTETFTAAVAETVIDIKSTERITAVAVETMADIKSAGTITVAVAASLDGCNESTSMAPSIYEINAKKASLNGNIFNNGNDLDSSSNTKNNSSNTNNNCNLIHNLDHSELQQKKQRAAASNKTTPYNDNFVVLNMYAEMAFIEEFTRDELLIRGKEGYVLVTLQASMAFIHSSSKHIGEDDASGCGNCGCATSSNANDDNKGEVKICLFCSMTN